MMCELCNGDFERTFNLEVSRAAMAVQRCDPFGAMHIVVEDTNVENDDIRSCMLSPGATDIDLYAAWLLLGISEGERISALAMAANLYGCGPVPYRNPSTT